MAPPDSSPSTERSEDERNKLLLSTQTQILERIARGADLHEVLLRIMRFMEAQLSGVRTSVLLVDENGEHLRSVAAPTLPAAYTNALDGLEIGPESGSCGAAAFHAREVITPDIQAEPNWLRFRALAKSHDIRACWSLPLSRPTGGVLGTFALYYAEPRTPTLEERAFAQVAAHLAEVAVSSWANVAELRTRERRLDRMAEFRRGVLRVMESALKGDATGLYQRIIDHAVRSISGAQAGSLLVRDPDDRFRFAAVNGYDMQELSKVRLTAEGAAFGVGLQGPEPQVVTELKMDPGLTPDEAQVMTEHGRDNELASVLVVPVMLDDIHAAYLTLDNFEGKDVFTPDSVEEARIYAGYAAMLLERFKLEERLQDMAYSDPLTGLPNRSRFWDLLQEAVLEAQFEGGEVAVLFLDLDNLKPVNDTLGHWAGDEVLKVVAARLATATSSSATLARIGGDEFTILARGPSVRGMAEVLARRAAEALEAPIPIGDNVAHVGLSIGVSIFPDHGRTPEDLMRRADIAMYYAKTHGRVEPVFFEPEMENAPRQRLLLDERLRRALANDEIIVHYQPRVDVRTGRILSFEALVRWQDPERGLVPPGQFVPLAERTNLIIPLGKRVLHLAATQVRAWRAGGHRDMRVSINLSARQVAQDDLVADLSEAVSRAGLDPRALEVEVVERVAMTDVEGSRAKLAALRELGVKVALDDFGTGYSSLSYLRAFPIDVLKIDGSFLASLGSENGDASVFRAIVALGKGFGMSVVAEGVETEAQWRAVQSLGCDEAQGFYLCRPVPAEQASRLLELQAAGRLTLPEPDA